MTVKEAVKSLSININKLECKYSYRQRYVWKLQRY